jgi:hypothetical protein
MIYPPRRSSKVGDGDDTLYSHFPAGIAAPFSHEWSGNRRSWFAHDKPSGRGGVRLQFSKQDVRLAVSAPVGMMEARRSWG